MGDVRTLHFVASLALPLTAWLVARSHREHRVIAWFATWMAATDLIRVVLMKYSMAPGHPKLGWALVAFHMDRAIVLSWTFFFFACVTHYFTKVRARSVVAAWALCTATLTATYPHDLRWFAKIFTAVYLATCVVTWILVARAVLRRTVEPSLARFTLVAYAASDVVILAVPLLGANFTHWNVARFSSLLCLMVLIAAHFHQLVLQRVR